jgi:hypothetical protein
MSFSILRILQAIAESREDVLHAAHHRQTDRHAGRLGDAREVLRVVEQGHGATRVEVRAREALKVGFQRVGQRISIRVRVAEEHAGHRLKDRFAGEFEFLECANARRKRLVPASPTPGDAFSDRFAPPSVTPRIIAVATNGRGSNAIP